MLRLHQDGIDLGNWVDGFRTEPAAIEGLGSFSLGELKYYYRKFLFLQKNGYFSQPGEETFKPGFVKPETMEYTLANSRQITFEVTDMCNLKCEYCGYGHFYDNYDNRAGRELDIDAAKRLLNYMLGLWNSPLNMSHGKSIFISYYGGEPLLNIKFIKKIVRFLEQRGSPRNRFVFTMTTNALLLEKHMDYLVQKQFRLLISLDGDEKSNGYRVLKNGKPGYPLIIKNINALKEKYPDYFEKYVNFNAVLHNLNTVSSIHQFVKKNFNRVPRVGELKDIGVKNSKQKDFWKMYTSLKESFYDGLKDSMDIKKEMFINLPDVKQTSLFLLKYSGFVYENYRHLLSPGAFKKKFPTGTCFPFSKKIFVTAGGKILPCETIGHEFYLGTVTRNELKLDLSRIAEKYNAYFEKIAGQCQRCYNKDACSTCIFNLEFVTHQPVCRREMNQTQFSDYVASNLTQLEWDPKMYKKIAEEVTIAG
jgi:uncharacterized protein